MPGRGEVSLYAFGDNQKYGAGTDISLKLRDNLAIYAGGKYWKENQLDYWLAQAGLLWRF